MKGKILFAFLVLALLSISSVYAITGSIGNSRMVLRMDVGETAERYILIKNVNDAPINVELYPTGDLKDYVNMQENNITIPEGEEHKVYFTIKAAKEGATETKIMILFKPKDHGNGVGLTSTIIVLAGDTAQITDEADADNTDTINENVSNNSSFSFNPNPNTVPLKDSKGISLSPMVWLSISTAILIIIFIALFLYASKKSKSKKNVKGSE